MKKLFILLAVLFLPACERFEDKPEEPFYPLDIGNYWTYERTSYNSTKQIYESDTITNTITKTDIIDGDEWYYMEKPNALYNGEHVKNYRDGFWRKLKFHDEKYTIRELAYPVKLGKCFDQHYRDTFKRTHESGRVLDTIYLCYFGDVHKRKELVTVPAGSYECVVIDIIDKCNDDNNNWTKYNFIRNYYCRGVGLIKREELDINFFYPYDTTFNYREELIDYLVK